MQSPCALHAAQMKWERAAEGEQGDTTSNKSVDNEN